MEIKFKPVGVVRTKGTETEMRGEKDLELDLKGLSYCERHVLLVLGQVPCVRSPLPVEARVQDR